MSPMPANLLSKHDQSPQYQFSQHFLRQFVQGFAFVRLHSCSLIHDLDHQSLLILLNYQHLHHH